MDNHRTLLLVHVEHGDPRQGNRGSRQMVVQFATQRQGETIDLAGREESGQGSLAVGGDNRPIAQPGRGDLIQFQVFWDLEPHLVDRPLLSQDLDFAFQRRLGLTEPEQRAQVGRRARPDLGHDQANLKRRGGEFVGLVVPHLQRAAETTIGRGKLLGHVGTVGPGHAPVRAGLQFQDGAAADLDRAPVQGRIRDRDERDRHIRRCAQWKHHPTRQMHRELFALLHRLEQFHRQEAVLGLRREIPAADVLPLDQFHQIIAGNFHAKRAAIGLAKAEIEAPRDVQAVLADIDDGQ